MRGTSAAGPASRTFANVAVSIARAPVKAARELTSMHGASGAKAAEQRANRLTHAEFEREATWATRKFVPFVMQRISVAVQIAAATEIRQALGRGMGPDSA